MNGERKTVEIPRLVEPTFQPQKLQMCGEQKRHEGVFTSAGNAASGWECLMCETCVELDKKVEHYRFDKKQHHRPKVKRCRRPAD